jgi:hypothetical protein
MTNGRNYFFCETESNFVSHLRLDYTNASGESRGI